MVTKTFDLVKKEKFDEEVNRAKDAENNLDTNKQNKSTLDTDVSALGYAKKETETVLWENPDTTIDFEETEITVTNVNQYKYIKILSQAGTVNTNLCQQLVLDIATIVKYNKYEVEAPLVHVEDQLSSSNVLTVKYVTRAVYIIKSTNTIKIWNCVLRTIASNGTASIARNNALLIPTKIIGIK